MENASKALLIAAAILVVILLIAFGMSVLQSTGDVGDAAQNTGAAMSTQINAASGAAVNALGNISKWY